MKRSRFLQMRNECASHTQGTPWLTIRTASFVFLWCLERTPRFTMQPIRFSILGLILILCASCGEQAPVKSPATGTESTELSALADEVRSETLRSWKAYKNYAWGHDVLAPISRTHRDWYSEPLYISPIDAYSTLVLMGFDDEAAEVERYVVDSLSFDKDVDVKIFEVNIRILGGLLSMYSHCKNPQVL
ncbi:MAG: glycoside hydrolase family 47 protein, partial [Flavobacteriales bacterium]|nr:glycoside hydrolase family 47 protein [Flavobacteriales bacterium]